MSRRIIDRRRFLTGAGVLLSLPFFQSLFPKQGRAAPGDLPKRLVVVYTGQGMPLQHWTPTGTPQNYQLNDIFQEPVDVGGGQQVTLADFKDDLVMLSGIDKTTAVEEGGNAHNASAGHSLCAIPMLPGGNDQDHTLSGGPSIDHVIAQAITPPTVGFSALHLGVRSPWEVCYTGAAEPVSRLQTPNEIADALFGDFTNPDTSAVQKLRAQRNSVLSATKDNISWLRPRLSGEDRLRLDEYLERVDAIEQRINATIALGEQCTPIAGFDLQKSPSRQWAPEVSYFHPYYDPDIASPPVIDCAVEALACDRTRVVTIGYGDMNIWHWLNDMNGNTVQALQTGDWHQDTVHAYWGSSAGDELLEDHLRRVARWQHSQIAYLLHKLATKQEGEGRLLDNCLVLFVNEFGEETHVHTNHPYFIAGGCGGAIETGRWLQYPGQPHNRLFLSMLQAFDIDADVFGDPAHCGDGPLPGLVT